MPEMRFAKVGDEMVTFSTDDLQICVDVSLLAARLEKAHREMMGCHVVETVSKMSKFNADYCDRFKNDPVKLGRFCFEQLLRLYRDSEPL